MKTQLKGVFVGCMAFALNAAATTPIITSQPQSQTINIASTANFAVTATNAATYQWKFGNNTIAGATKSTLTLDDVTTNQAGSYTVVVTSSTGDPTNSQPAQLTLVPGTIVQLTFSGYAAGGASNLTLQLFDHDKPATVENFLHYIVSGAYSNLFWTRCVPGFILQAGDYFTHDRTNGPPPQISSVESDFTDLAVDPPFPRQIDNEYGVGPLIHNTFGTIAMAKSSGDPDSAVNVFFFNLADNSTNLDNQNGGFTVFGRILSGTNILNYFNTFSMPTIFDRLDTSGAPTNGIFNGGGPLNTLPVNYHGLATPGNSNFFFIDFAFPTPPILDTNLPTIAVVYPTNNATVTNGDVIVRGTAADNVGLALNFCFVSSPGFNGGNPDGGYAIGTTNWSLDCGNLAPGTYTLDAVAQDAAGNISTNGSGPLGRLLTSFIVPQFPVNVTAVGPGKLSANLTVANTTVGSNYVVKAIPTQGGVFVNWADGTNVSLDPAQGFTMPNGLQLTATFISNTLPGGISFTYPAANAKVGTTNVALAGKVAGNAGLTTITAQFFSKTDGSAVSRPMVTTGSAAWSMPTVQLVPGQYIAQALASNAAGKTTVISEDFTILTPLTVNIAGPGTTSISNGAYLQAGAKYTIRATPKPGAFFYGWDGPTGLTSDPTIAFIQTNGLVLDAFFISNALPKAISFAYPSPNSTVQTNSFILTGNVSASVNSPQIICQLFSGMVPANGVQYATVNGTTWSVPLTNLQQGAYTVVAIASDSAGSQTLISENFKVNLYPPIAGTYYAVFFDTNNIATNNAGLIKLAVSGTGVMTGKLQFPIFTYTIYYPLGPAGGVQLQGSDVTLDVRFDLTTGSDTMSGYVYAQGTVLYFTGYRAVTELPANTPPGKYGMNLETITNLAAFGPTNDGYATLSIASTGALMLGGTLADNTAFSEGTGISKEGVWPVYTTLYGGHGLLIGWETNVIGPNGPAGFAGTVYWVKAPGKSAYYPNGLNIEAAMTGTNYVAPAPGTQYQVVFAGGSVNPPLNNSLTVSPSGAFVPAAGAADKLTISLSASGVITGKFYNPADGQTLSIRGSFTSPTLGGSGFILDTGGQTEPFRITLVP